MKCNLFTQTAGLALMMSTLLPNVAQSAVGSVTVDWTSFELKVIDQNARQTAFLQVGEE